MKHVHEVPQLEAARDEIIKTRDRVKQHMQDHPKLYALGFAGITWLIVRGASPHINRGISVVASRGISATGENVAQNVIVGNNNTLHSVSYISANRQGPPSWVVRCLETNKVFTSQSAAAGAMELPAAEISKHLCGTMENVRGYHFERLCMAA